MASITEHKLTNNDISQRWMQILLVFIILIAALLRLVTLPFFSFYGDEVWTLRYAEESLSYILSHLQTGLSMHLYILFIKAWMNVFGNSELALKTPSLIAGITTIPLLFHLGRRWINQKTAIITALLATFSVPLVVISRYARVYAILAVVTIFIVWIYIQALQKRRLIDFVLLGLVNGIALMLSGNTGYMILVQGCSIVIEAIFYRDRDWKLLFAFGGSVMLSLAVTVLFYINSLSDIPLMFITSTGSEQLRFDFFIDVPRRLFPYATPIMIILLLLGSWLALRYRGTVGRFLVLWAFIPLIFFFLIGARQPEWAVARFLLPTVPAHYILISLSILHFSQKIFPLKNIRAAFIGTVLLIFFGLLFSIDARQRIFAEMFGTSVAVKRINALVEPDDVLTADPGYWHWAMKNRIDTRLLTMNVMVNQQIFGREGKLVILVSDDVTGIDCWSRNFSIEIISDPHYIRDLLIVSSPKLFNENEFRQTLIHYFTGKLHGLDHGMGENDTPQRFYNRLAKTHQFLASLKQHDYPADEVAVHLQMVDEYRQLAEQSGNFK